jgi:hypothetical protein
MNYVPPLNVSNLLTLMQENPPDPFSCPSFSSESICHSEYLPFTAIVCSCRFNGLNYFQFFAPNLFSYSFRCAWPILICIDPFEFHFPLSLRFIFIVLFVPISSFWIQSIQMPSSCSMESMDFPVIISELGASNFWKISHY